VLRRKLLEEGDKETSGGIRERWGFWCQFLGLESIKGNLPNGFPNILGIKLRAKLGPDVNDTWKWNAVGRIIMIEWIYYEKTILNSF